MLKRSQKKRESVDPPVLEDHIESSNLSATVKGSSTRSEHRHTLVFSMFSIFGALVAVLLFFTTGISDKIVHANQKHPRIVQVSIPTPAVPIAQVVPESTLPTSVFTKEDMMRYLNKLSEEEAERLFDTIQKNKPASSSAKSSEMSSSLYEGIISSRIDTKERALSELQSMSDNDFKKFVNQITASNNTVDSISSNPLENTLDDAYAEAERRYPGQVHSSKRLKLIADRNIGSYLYYVTEPGDTLLMLSKSFKTPLGQLVELNGIPDADIIQAGEVLLFPSNTKQP